MDAHDIELGRRACSNPNHREDDVRALASDEKLEPVAATAEGAIV